MKKTFFILFLGLFLFWGNTNACTNFIFTKGSTTDGSVFVTYNADSHQLYGELYFFPRADWPAGSKLAVYEWDTGKYLGDIDQIPHTYQVVGNMNENQVIIGETTYGGLTELHHQKDAIVDYGSLIYIALQRSKTAREAIKVMADLMEKYGYYSEGESFSVADKNEAWIFEVIGKGEHEKGAVWVARMIPDGYVCAHANQARIMTFDYQRKNKWNDPKANTFNSKDVISFAEEYLEYKGSKKEFSFSDFYAPVDFGGARFCEIRVWSMFKDINADVKNNENYFDYAKGNVKHDDVFLDGTTNPNHFASNRMPLWIKPDHKISVHEVMNLMRDHLEGTELDMRKDVGAGPFECPYRWRGLTWEVDGKTYVNERATATQQTGFTFVGQARSWLPDPIGGIFWFGLDDPSSSVYTPIYCAIDEVPETYAQGNGSMIEWSDNSAFWTFNQVSNLAYTRYNVIHPEVEKLQQELEKDFIVKTVDIDKKAQELLKKDQKLAAQFLTEFSVKNANELVYKWKGFYQYLFMKYKDGNIMKTKDYKLLQNENDKNVPLAPDQPGYGEDWYRLIIEKTGEKFLLK